MIIITPPYTTFFFLTCSPKRTYFFFYLVVLVLLFCLVPRSLQMRQGLSFPTCHKRRETSMINKNTIFSLSIRSDMLQQTVSTQNKAAADQCMHCLPPIRQYSRLPLSRIPWQYPKHFEISLPRNIRVADVRKTINRRTTFNKWICNFS